MVSRAAVIVALVLVCLWTVCCKAHKSPPVEYPEGWPLPGLTAPVGSTPYLTTGVTQFDRGGYIKGATAHFSQPGMDVYAAGFQSALSWADIQAHFKQQLTPLGYMDDRPQEHSLSFVDPGHVNNVVIIRDRKDDSLYTILIYSTHQPQSK